MPDIHLKYGGSTADRTINCPAWLKLSADVPKQIEGANPAADLGTMLHNCMEILYSESGPDTASELLATTKQEYKGQVLTQELVDEKLTPAIECVENLLDEMDAGNWMVEPFIRLTSRG